MRIAIESDWVTARPRSRLNCVAIVTVMCILGQITLGWAPSASIALANALAEPSFVVTSTDDGADASVGDGVCSTATGHCTLRAAVQESNLLGTHAVIHFAIPASGPHTIQPQSELPALVNPAGITLDGYTQPGARPNDLQTGSNADLRVQLQGAGTSAHDGLVMTSGNNVVRGLALYGFRVAIFITGTSANENVIVGSFIGTDAGGTYRAPQAVRDANGMSIRDGASRNVIGRPTPADRNVISGAGHQGIGTYGTGTTGNVIQNNIVGLTPLGDANLGNWQHGIDLNYGTTDTQVGGTGALEGNVVSGNASSGIEVSHGSDTRFNQIVGNLIGTGPGGNLAETYTRNGHAAVRVEDNVGETRVSNNVIGNSGAFGVLVDGAPKRTVIEDNWIGVTPSGDRISDTGPGIRLASGAQFGSVRGNVIAYNAGNGIEILDEGTNRNRIAGNSIYGNDGLGIDVAPMGVVNTQEVLDTSAEGPSEKLAVPTLTSASASVIRGTSCPGCEVELFEADGSSTDHGEGRRLVASVLADADGAFELPASGVQGKVATVTAIDSRGNTSEFSHNIAVPDAAPNNAPPSANFDVSCSDLLCSFDGASSVDSDGTIDHWAWDLGDGTRTNGPAIEHDYPRDGSFDVTLTVTDNGGATSSTTRTVTVVAPPPPGTIALDRFERTGLGWGTAEVGGEWSVSRDGFSLQDGGGVIETASPGTDASAYLTEISEVDSDVGASFAADKPASGYGHLFAVVGRRVAQNAEYRARIRFAPDGSVNVAPVKVTGTTSEVLIAPEVTLPNTVLQAPDRLIRSRIEVRGLDPTRVRIKVWEASQPEPSGWHVDVFDAEPMLQTAGTIGLRAYLSRSSKNDPVLYRFDDLEASRNVAPEASFIAECDFLQCQFDGSASKDADGQVLSYNWDFGDGSTGTGATPAHEYAAPGEYLVSLTVTDDEGLTHSVSEFLTLHSRPDTGAFVRDTFGRAQASGWGSADTGGAYAHYNRSQLSVDGSQALVRIPSANSGAAAWLPERTEDAADISVVFATDKVATGWGQFAYVIGRRVAANWEYRARVRMAPDGTMRVAASKVAGSGGETTIGGEVPLPGLTHQPLSRYELRMQVSSATDELSRIRIKVWQADTPEPAGWAVDVEDDTAGLQAPGAVGLRAALPASASDTPVEVRFDDFVASPELIQPSATFTHNCDDATCTFDARDSFDSDGEIVSYEWSFGDGSTNTGSTTSHTYAASGVYTVRLTVTDDDGAQSTADRQVDVTVNQRPFASIEASCFEQGCDFNGTGSSDADGQIVSYDWEFGDGQTGSGPSVTHAYAESGTYTVQLTVTDDGGAQGVTSQQVTVTAPPLRRLVASDAFERTVGEGWGAADQGGPYTVFNAGFQSVASRAIVDLPSAGASAAAWLLDVNERDVDMAVQLRTDKVGTGFGQMMQLVGRRVVAGTEYRVMVRFAGGNVHLGAIKTVAGTTGDTWIETLRIPGITHVPGEPVRVRVRVSGTSPTTIRARVWPEGTQEPATWQLSVTDGEPALQESGAVGLRASLSGSVSNAPVRIEFDELAVTSSS